MQVEHIEYSEVIVLASPHVAEKPNPFDVDDTNVIAWWPDGFWCHEDEFTEAMLEGRSDDFEWLAVTTAQLAAL